MVVEAENKKAVEWNGVTDGQPSITNRLCSTDSITNSQIKFSGSGIKPPFLYRLAIATKSTYIAELSSLPFTHAKTSTVVHGVPVPSGRTLT